MSKLLDGLRGAIGDSNVLVLAEDVAPYVTDWRGRYSGVPLCVARPGSTVEVATVVQLCGNAGIPIVPQGGNTGLCGGATPIGGEVVLNLSRLNRIRSIDPDNNSITVEAGCILQNVQNAADKVDRLFPLSLASEGSATIGGNLSTNAGGVQVLRYGNARELVLGLEVVLPDGRIWDGLRALRKDNTGYDLKHLFVGAEGTLGLITAATLKLFPRPASSVTAWVSLTSPLLAVKLLELLRQGIGDNITAFEIIGNPALELVLQHIPGSSAPLSRSSMWHVLIEASAAHGNLAEEFELALVDSIDSGLVNEVVIASSEAQVKKLWALRENISEAQRIDGISIKHDIALPISSIAEFIQQTDAALEKYFPGLRIVCFGHLGDGNLHYNQSKPDSQANVEFIAQTPIVNRIVHDIVHSFGGSISAEHGLGQLKREENHRYKSSVELDLMRAIKDALDPSGMMNPGKLL
jgi:FAD/FMN-containing dehydrogenase